MTYYIRIDPTTRKFSYVSLIENVETYTITTDINLLLLGYKYRLSEDYTIVDGAIEGTIELIPAVLTLSTAEINLTVGGSEEDITAVVTNVEDTTVLFKSSNTAVATVTYDSDFDSYTITGVAIGTTTIKFVSKADRSIIQLLTVNVTA